MPGWKGAACPLMHSAQGWIAMLFKAAILELIREGRVTLAFRRWKRPTVKAGGTLKTAAGVLAIDEVAAIEPEDISDEDARRAGAADRTALLAELAQRSDDTLFRIAFHREGEDPRIALRERGAIDDDEWPALRQSLARLDRAVGDRTSWTTDCLRLIAVREGRTAGELAEALGWEKLTLKRRVRQLKALGLTESLQSGYRLSPRGQSCLLALPSRRSSG